MQVRLFIFISLWFLSFNASAKLVQILHTNDLHGFLEKSLKNEEMGGYAKIKTIIDKLKADAREKGIPTIVVDGGDFMEGSVFYLSDKGRRVFNIMNHMGYDAVVVGNHDWLMGTKDLNKLLEENPPQFAYLGANFKGRIIDLAINKHVQDYKNFDFDGIRLSVVGLTTDEIAYSWRFGGKIKSPEKIGRKLSKKLKKKKGSDFVIALTHAGLEKDRKIIKSSEHIDLVVGGHSHTVLKKPVYQKNKKDRKIPIVQAGEHGTYLGQLIVDLKKGKPLRIEKYKLHPVFREKESSDPIVEEYVTRSREILYRDYGKDYLEETVGHSKVPLENSWMKMTTWAAFTVDAIKDSVGADVAFNAIGLSGPTQKAGDLTREVLFNAYPRQFDFKDKHGWAVYEVNIAGVFLKWAVKLILKTQQSITFSGITFDLISRETGEEIRIEHQDKGSGVTGPIRFRGIDEQFKVKNMRIKGKKIKWFKRYKVALPEGIVRGGLGISKFVRIILKSISKTETTVWQALIDKAQQIGTLTSDYKKDDLEHVSSTKKSSENPKAYEKYQNYMFVPGKK